ncbi:MAG: Ig-like domain-containing protein [Granulosicoccus sp.]
MSHSAVYSGSLFSQTRLLPSCCGLILGLTLSGAGVAAGQVNSIATSEVPATPFTYTLGEIEYQWGMGSNQFMEGFTTTTGEVYSYAMSADRVDVLRDDILGVTTGEPCGIFVERLQDSDTSRVFSADYPSDGSGTGNCDLSSLLSSRVINRGAVDLFSNKLPDAKNIERLDYVYDYGLLAPFVESDLALAGHAAAEKSSNNPVKAAAILSLDVLGRPSAFGPLVLVGEHNCYDTAVCYGITDLQHTYSFLQNDLNEPQSFPVETERSVESVGMAFLSTLDLGLSAGQRYYGISFFADDVDAELHNLLDPSTFPNDTSDDNVVPGDDADIYGGLAGYFLEEAVTVATGSVFNDIDGNGVPDETEAGISDISITVYEDINGNGIVDADIDLPIGDSIDSDMSGNFVLPGIPNGNFLVVLDSNDPDLPPGLISAPGTNPHVLNVAGTDTNTVYFPFINPDGNGGTDGGTDGATDSGSSDGATDSGTSDSGTTDGTTDSGASDSGATDGTSDGGTADGGVDGATDSGTADSGSTDGASDGGTADSGATDSGTTDSGTSDGAADSGTTDSGTSDGNTDSGTADSGGSDGTTDSGSTDSGASDGGSTDSGSTPIDDGSTAAVDDTFEINQGTSATFDVLANDTDASGGGLTLVSVSQSPNAALSVVDNQVSYQPNFGFYGVDTFLYVMTDADGTEVTGNVSVNVVRFSDLNGNMVNDFVECGCTNLILETGVHGVGIGRLSQLVSLVLMLAVWIRRRTNRTRATCSLTGEELR